MALAAPRLARERRRAVPDAKPVLLEPVNNVEVTVPEDNVGDIMGDMNTWHPTAGCIEIFAQRYDLAPPRPTFARWPRARARVRVL